MTIRNSNMTVTLLLQCCFNGYLLANWTLSYYISSIGCHFSKHSWVVLFFLTAIWKDYPLSIQKDIKKDTKAWLSVCVTSVCLKDSYSRLSLNTQSLCLNPTADPWADVISDKSQTPCRLLSVKSVCLHLGLQGFCLTLLSLKLLWAFYFCCFWLFF